LNAKPQDDFYNRGSRVSDPNHYTQRLKRRFKQNRKSNSRSKVYIYIYTYNTKLFSRGANGVTANRTVVAMITIIWLYEGKTNI
jgi:hypothetical protein